MKNSTENRYKQKVNQVIDYIHSNLHQPLRLNVIADKVNMSQRQLLRMMRAALNEPLSAYVARQRMERAVLYMQTEEISLQDLAGWVGYDNPQSFSKAFKKQFGISPKTYIGRLKMRLKESVHDGKMCDLPSEVYHFEGLHLVYIRIWGKYGEKEPYETAWNKLIHFLKENDLLASDTRFIGLSFDDPHVTPPNQCRFYACASVPKEIVPTCEFGTIRLPQGKYAVYTLQGEYTDLQEWYDMISVSREHSLRHGMSFEEYIHYSKNKNEHIAKIYIPIK
ncbi:GyrI-like domain-containing protein [Bacteroides sp. AN502(2024)]|uniref:AraC family transcriptional regulator n=1 Tax=Bacteroides sp. AN502(2024) TaxID=3160599 RepID=UPI0035175F4A